MAKRYVMGRRVPFSVRQMRKKKEEKNTRRHIFRYSCLCFLILNHITGYISTIISLYPDRVESFWILVLGTHTYVVYLKNSFNRCEWDTKMYEILEKIRKIRKESLKNDEISTVD